MKFADHIKVTEDGIEIDGESFPWYITEEGATTQVSRNDLPSVTVTIMAHHVEVQNYSPARRSEQ